VSDQQEIADVLVRYASGIDRRDWARFRSCWTEDCDVDYGAVGHWHGADEVTAWAESVHAPCGYTMHRITNMDISVCGDAATARSYSDALVLRADNVAGNEVDAWYDDELVRTADGWKIAHRRLTIVRVQAVG